MGTVFSWWSDARQDEIAANLPRLPSLSRAIRKRAERVQELEDYFAPNILPELVRARLEVSNALDALKELDAISRRAVDAARADGKEVPVREDDGLGLVWVVVLIIAGAVAVVVAAYFLGQDVRDWIDAWARAKVAIMEADSRIRIAESREGLPDRPPPGPGPIAEVTGNLVMLVALLGGLWVWSKVRKG